MVSQISHQTPSKEITTQTHDEFYHFSRKSLLFKDDAENTGLSSSLTMKTESCNK